MKENIKLFKRILGLVVFVGCLTMIFETEIRSIGHSEEDPVGAIALLPGLYLLDLAMMLPIFLAVLTPKPKLPSSTNRALFFLIFSFLYGLDTLVWHE